MLLTVLVVAAVGLLFGAGALLLFRYQCQMRIDRQHEFEKVYAVRSALNYIRTSTTTRDISDAGKPFMYHTGSGRDLPLLVKPVSPIFPDFGNPSHLDVGNIGKKGRVFDIAVPDNQCNGFPDYEYGALGTTNLLTGPAIRCQYTDSGYGLAFVDPGAPIGAKWWVNLGMPGTGGWLESDYGRRYIFRPQYYVGGDAATTADIMRLCIIRNVTNETNDVGCRCGWPLSRERERALVFEIHPLSGGVADKDNGMVNATMTFSEYVYSGGHVVVTNFLRLVNQPSKCNMGIQLAGNRASVFYVANNGTPNGDLSVAGYTFSNCIELPRDTYDYFAKQVSIGGKTYGGMYTNRAGRVDAPELRAVLEVEAASSKRQDGGGVSSDDYDFIADFQVRPAYQYDVFIEHPEGNTNLATVAQKIGTYDRDVSPYYAIFTYDKHGTEHRGFRRDEREKGR